MGEDSADDSFWVHLNHYQLLSREAYARKIRRGDVLSESHDHLRSWAFYDTIDARATTYDTELRDKRRARRRDDLKRCDMMLCGMVHVGGVRPDWCENAR